MTFFNIKFKDGNFFISLDDEMEGFGGCETCDYGSQYINRFSFVTTNYIVDVEFNQMYEYAVSVGDIIKIIAVDLGNFTEKEFVEHVRNHIQCLGEEKAKVHWDKENPLKKLEVKERENG